MRHVPHDSDNRERRASRRPQTNTLAERILVRPIALLQILVDHGDGFRVRAIILRKIAPTFKGYRHRFHVAGRDPPAIGARYRFVRAEGAAFDRKQSALVVVTEWDRPDEPRSRNSWSRAHPLQNLGIVAGRNRKGRCHDAFRIEAGIDGLKAYKTLDKKARGDQQRQSQGGFTHHQEGTKPLLR
jgi:hypothetical protein